VVRPRLFWTGERARSALLTLGSTFERRDGGTLVGATAPDGDAYGEALRTERFDAGAVARLPFARSVLTVRGSASTQGHRHRFGAVRERDRHDTWFGETALATTRGVHTAVVGAAFQWERYRSRDVAGFDYAYSIPAAFAQYDVAPRTWLSLSASARADAHSAYGTFVNPRVSLLVRPLAGWTARLSGGTGAFAPTPFTDETEVTGLAPVVALRARAAPRSTSAARWAPWR
jgi:iron complex outermembrane receptor protein